MPQGPFGGPRPLSNCNLSVQFYAEDGGVRRFIEGGGGTAKLERQMVEVTGMTIDSIGMDITEDIITIHLEGGRMKQEVISMVAGVVSSEVGDISDVMVVSE